MISLPSLVRFVLERTLELGESRSRRARPINRSSGVVLPVVLVLLTVLMGVVLAQMKRGGTDERIAANTRDIVVMENAAESVLRWCEAVVAARPGGTVTALGTPTTPAWRIASNWDAPTSLSFSGTVLVSAMSTEPRCVIEDATCELQPPVSPTGLDTGGCNGIDSRWRKFRITARVRSSAPDLLSGQRESMAQSELRLFVQ